MLGTSLRAKLAPPAPPRRWAADLGVELPPIDIAAPGRPRELTVVSKGHRTPKVTALRDPRVRAEQLHTFMHHELQAAELMCRALLAYPQTPAAFRRGLIQIALDEVRHMAMYAGHIESLGFAFGDFPVNDWFWRKLRPGTPPLSFVALMGLGFEGGNLDHTQRFADRFRRAGDERGAQIQEQIGEEEIPHVRFAAHWFERFSGSPVSFEAWAAALPAPLTPLLMRGRPVQREARARAGYSREFIDKLSDYTEVPAAEAP